MSGGKLERPRLTELVDHARSGDRLCFTRLDRLGGSLKELPKTVEDLKQRGIHLVSQEEKNDTASAASELVFHVFGAIAQLTRDGVAAAKKHGKIPGRPRLAVETVSAVKNLVDAGMTQGQAAKQLGIGRSTAYRITRSLTAS